MSETPTTTTSQKKYRNTPPICIAIRLPFVPQYFWCPYALRKGNTVSTPPICIAVRLPFVLQYASHLYRNTFGKILVVVVTGMFPNRMSRQFPRFLRHFTTNYDKIRQNFGRPHFGIPF